MERNDSGKTSAAQASEQPAAGVPEHPENPNNDSPDDDNDIPEVAEIDEEDEYESPTKRALLESQGSAQIESETVEEAQRSAGADDEEEDLERDNKRPRTGTLNVAAKVLWADMTEDGVDEIFIGRLKCDHCEYSKRFIRPSA